MELKWCFLRVRSCHCLTLFSPTVPFCVFSVIHSMFSFFHFLTSFSPLDYLPTPFFLRRLPHLDAPVMISSSVSNVNVSVQLGDTTPFALGFISIDAGTFCCNIKHPIPICWSHFGDFTCSNIYPWLIIWKILLFFGAFWTKICPTLSSELQHLLDLKVDKDSESQNLVLHQRAAVSLENFWWRVGQGSHIQQAPHPPGKHVWGEALVLDFLSLQVKTDIRNLNNKNVCLCFIANWVFLVLA